MNINEINQALADGKLEIIDGKVREVPTPWGPKGGSFLVETNGTVTDVFSQYERRSYGSECKTLGQGRELSMLQRRFNRLYQYIREHAPKHDVTSEGYIVETTESQAVCYTASRPSITDLTMPEHVAYKLRDMINNGEYEI